MANAGNSEANVVETSPVMVSIHFIGSEDFGFYHQKWTSWFCWRILIWGRGEYGQCLVSTDSLSEKVEGCSSASCHGDKQSPLTWWRDCCSCSQWTSPHCCELGVSGHLWNPNCRQLLAWDASQEAARVQQHHTCMFKPTFQTAWKQGGKGVRWEQRLVLGQAAVCPTRDHHWPHYSHSLCQSCNLAKIKLEWGRNSLADQFPVSYLLQKISINVLFKIRWLVIFFGHFFWHFGQQIASRWFHFQVVIKFLRSWNIWFQGLTCITI